MTMFCFLMIYVIGYISYILCHYKRIGKIEKSIEGVGTTYYRVTIWWIMLEAFLWFLWFYVLFVSKIVLPDATKEDYENQIK